MRASEDDLEPRDLIHRCNLVLKAGILMLGAGTSSLRVRDLMRAVARDQGMDELRAQITYTGIVLTVTRRGIFRTQTSEVRGSGVNAHRIEMLHDLTKRLRAGEEVDVERRLRVIEHTRPLHRARWLAALVALACASITVLSHGGWREVLAVLPASMIAYGLHRTLIAARLNVIAVMLTSTVVASAGYVGFAALLAAVTGSPSSAYGVGLVSASIFLIPGFPLVTAGLDITRLDMSAGIPRLGYAAVVLLAMGIGVWVVATLAGVSPQEVPVQPWHPLLLWSVRLLASFTAVFGWAMMFNSPTSAAVASGTIAVIGNALRLTLLDHQVSNHVATFVGCVLIGLLCAVAGAVFDLEKIIMTVPTLLISIPGGAALRTLLYFDTADTLRALQNAVAVVLAVIAMVGGLSVARMVTDPEWAFTRPDPPQLRLGLPGLRRRR